MSSTNLQLNGTDLESKLHIFFGTIRPDPEDVVKSSSIKNYPLESNLGNKGFILTTDYYTFKKYWLVEQDNKIIVTTALLAHGDLKTKFEHNLNQSEIAELIEQVKLTYKDKEIHFIIPRVETSLLEDHNVIEYHNVSKGSSMIVDSKRAPSGFKHSDIANRIHTERQGFFNSTDCGFHVAQLIPVLNRMIKQDIEITSDNINAELPQDSAQALAIHKLEKLKSLYARRVDDKEFFHTTFLFFKWGYSAASKGQAVSRILINIKNQEQDLFKYLNPIDIEAAKQGVLGGVVQEYLNAIEASAQNLSREI
ncbi:MAG: hypothetical protein H0T84_06915 [Tatlockia sp.]|nr:hypothetical protein [Tatlockia sp.]